MTKASVDGFLLVDKPAGITSHGVVSRCRKAVGQKRIGHSGTLDPDATGVLLVALGKATRLIRFFDGLTKAYRCEMVLGTATSSLDDSGDVTQTWDMSAVTLGDVEAASEKFLGPIEQVPPMVSALKIDGQRLHELARQGIEVERKARNVVIHSLRIEPVDQSSVFGLSTVCSTGTYVRSLVADIGTALGGGAHLRNLRRTAIGPFSDAEAVALDELEKDYRQYVLEPAKMMSHLPALVLADDASAIDVSHGRSIPMPADEVTGFVCVLNASGQLLGVYEPAEPGRLKASVVLANA